MTRSKLLAAVNEAQRFLRAADIALKQHASYSDGTPIPEGLPTGSRENSAVKRASLDLTRALAEMRKP